MWKNKFHGINFLSDEWQTISICLMRTCKTWFLARGIATLLSQYSFIGASIGIQCISGANSNFVTTIAIIWYSTSTLDLVQIFNLLLLHITNFSPKLYNLHALIWHPHMHWCNVHAGACADIALMHQNLSTCGQQQRTQFHPNLTCTGCGHRPMPCVVNWTVVIFCHLK